MEFQFSQGVCRLFHPNSIPSCKRGMELAWKSQCRQIHWIIKKSPLNKRETSHSSSVDQALVAQRCHQTLPYNWMKSQLKASKKKAAPNTWKPGLHSRSITADFENKMPEGENFLTILQTFVRLRAVWRASLRRSTAQEVVRLGRLEPVAEADH